MTSSYLFHGYDQTIQNYNRYLVSNFMYRNYADLVFHCEDIAMAETLRRFDRINRLDMLPEIKGKNAFNNHLK